MELRDVVRRLKAEQGIRRIHEETGVHRTIIRALRDTAEADKSSNAVSNKAGSPGEAATEGCLI